MNENNIGFKSVYTVATKDGGVLSAAFNDEGTVMTLNIVEKVSNSVQHPIETQISGGSARAFAGALFDRNGVANKIKCDDEFETVITVRSSDDYGRQKELHFQDNDGTKLVVSISRAVAYFYGNIIRKNMNF